MKKTVTLFFILLSTVVSARTFYVAPGGNDNNPGSIILPWQTWGKAFTSNSVFAGDTVYFRGGVYMKVNDGGSGYTVTRGGSSTNNPVCYFNYPGEEPILDCRNVVPTGTFNFGVKTILSQGYPVSKVDFIRFRGLTIRNVWQVKSHQVYCKAWYSNDGEIIYENCVAYNIHGSGFVSEFSGANDGSHYYINCDAHDICDSLTVDPGMLVGNIGNGFNANNFFNTLGHAYFYGCRAWRCSDQGFGLGDIYTENIGCWSFSNGALEGDGHGFKMGWTQFPSDEVRRVIHNCIAAYNRFSGFITNDVGYPNVCKMQIYNNTVYHTGYRPGYSYQAGIYIDNTSGSDKDELNRIFKNNISYKNQGYPVYLGSGASYSHDHNTWDTQVTLTDEDFVTLDSTGLSGPRNPDGSLPDLDFLKLSANSDLIDKGVDVGLSYLGSAPDLGFSEGNSLSTNFAIPVYITSVIENSAPSKLVIKYNISLANVVPSVKAFTVEVNSVKLDVNSVTVSGSTLILSLVSPVKSGDQVTIAYTRPSTNPVQSIIGDKALSFSPRAVTNKVTSGNILPTVTIDAPKTSYSGFLNEISVNYSSATNVSLEFAWSAPAIVPISSTTGTKIKFLGPVVSQPTKVEFTLQVSDGKTKQTILIPVQIIPYHQELEMAEVENIEASSFQSPNVPYNIIDGNGGTYWSANGINQWLILELKEPFNAQHIKVSFQPGQNKEFYFDITGSNDKSTWETILTKSGSCGFSGNTQIFEFPEAKANKEFKYIKFNGKGNSWDQWNVVSEFRIYGFSSGYRNEYNALPVKIYPNPATESVTVRIDEPSINPDLIQLVDMSGYIKFSDKIDSGVRELTIPLNVKKGIYVIRLISRGMTLFTQKLITLN